MTTSGRRHVFDMTDGWDGKPPNGIDHVVVVTHRPQPEAFGHFVVGADQRSPQPPQPQASGWRAV